VEGFQLAVLPKLVWLGHDGPDSIDRISVRRSGYVEVMMILPSRAILVKTIDVKWS
jgi:hypothetical protein